MKSLAQDVGGLKSTEQCEDAGHFRRSAVRGIAGTDDEPGTDDANVKTKKSGTEFVEFAIKLPGKDDHNSTVYLPIDAKFPKDVYDVYDAFLKPEMPYDRIVGKQLENTIKKMAKDIHDKYVDLLLPPILPFCFTVRKYLWR